MLLASEASGQDVLKVKAYALNDLSGYYRVRPNVVLRAGINNLFDVLPPYPLPESGVGPASGGVYDQIGRFWFIGLNLKL